METIVAPNTNFFRSGVLTKFASNFGRGLGGILVGRNLSKSFRLPTTIVGVIGTPQMVFTNPIMTTHVNKIGN